MCWEETPLVKVNNNYKICLPLVSRDLIMLIIFCSENQTGHYDDPRGLSDAVVAIQKLLQVIQNSKGDDNDLNISSMYMHGALYQ